MDTEEPHAKQEGGNLAEVDTEEYEDEVAPDGSEEAAASVRRSSATAAGLADFYKRMRLAKLELTAKGVSGPAAQKLGRAQATLQSPEGNGMKASKRLACFTLLNDGRSRAGLPVVKHPPEDLHFVDWATGVLEGTVRTYLEMPKDSVALGCSKCRWKATCQKGECGERTTKALAAAAVATEEANKPELAGAAPGEAS